MSLELYKLVQNYKDINLFRNAFLNQAVNIYVISKATGPELFKVMVLLLRFAFTEMFVLAFSKIGLLKKQVYFFYYYSLVTFVSVIVVPFLLYPHLKANKSS